VCRNVHPNICSRQKCVFVSKLGLSKACCLCLCVRELRLTEAIHEPHICENILQYNVHAERKGSLRYAKGMSETMQTLHGLVYVFLCFFIQVYCM